MRELLGGKGANVAEMTRILGADRVPGGFTITTEACVAYMREEAFPDGLRRAGRRGAGGARGARGQEARRRRRPAAGLRALGRARVDAGHARHRPEPRPQRRVGAGAGDEDRERALRVGLLPALRADVRQRRARHRGRALRGRDQARQGRPRRQGRHRARRRGAAGAHAQLQGALRVPHRPARAARAGHPGRLRLLERRARGVLPAHQPHPRRLGHRGQRAADGVRQQGRQQRLGRRLQPRRGHRRAGAQRRLPRSTPRARTSSRACATRWTSPSSSSVLPEVHAQLMEILRELERHYGDMQDTEFTVEEGRLYMLQTRNAKRPAQAAVRFAVDAVERGAARQGAGADRRSTPRRSTRCCTRPSTRRPSTRCSPRAWPPRRARRSARSSSPPPTRWRRRPTGRDVILVRPFTEADDVAGFHAAKGILTSEGGKASHAALVARGMGVPAVTGASDLEIDLAAGEVRVDGDDAARRRPDRHRRHHRLDHHRRRPARRARGRRGVRHRPAVGRRAAHAGACAPTPTRPRTRARRASSAPRASGCAAPSTCSSARTATRRWSRSSSPPRTTSAASASTSCCRCSRATSRGSSRRWRGCRSPSACSTRRCTSSCPDPDDLPEGPQRDRARSLQEVNPMLGTRGVRLGLLYPEIYEMQVRAMLRAAGRARAHGRDAPPRGHGPARRLRARARAACATRSSASPTRRAWSTRPTTRSAR